MQQTVQAFVGAMAVLLAGVAVVGALALLIAVEGYYLVSFGTRLYWRCKESLRHLRVELGTPPLSRRDQASRRTDRLSRRQGHRTQADLDGRQGAVPPEDGNAKHSGDEEWS
jgi:hypothetical protein